MKYDLADKSENEGEIESDGWLMSYEGFLDFFIEDLTIHGHKIPADVELENETVLAVISGTGTDGMFQPPYTVGCPSTHTTTVHIVYENPFENGTDVIEDEVMHDAITEISGENLPLHGIEGDETNAFRYFISSVYYRAMQVENTAFVIEFEFESVDGRPFVSAGVVVRTKQVDE